MVHLLLVIIYLAFISLGLPDALLGAAWPSMYPQFDVPVSYAGIVSMIIALGTVISSLQSDRLTKKLGTGKVTALSVCMTAMALFGFATSHSFGMLCLWAIPYGLGAGSVDASLNNYVALHYESRHMSWLHCMWGVGASAGPYIMGYALTAGWGWNSGYHIIAVLQIVLTAILLCSLPLWKQSRLRCCRMERCSLQKHFPYVKYCSLPEQGKYWSVFSAIVPWSRQQDCGRAVTSPYIKESPQIQQLPLQVCFILELLWDEH